MKSCRNGFALVCVLWILAILTVITLGFGRRAMLERRATSFSLDHTKAIEAARGAVARGLVELRNKSIYDSLNNTAGRTSHRQNWAAPVDLVHSPDGYYAAVNGMHSDDAVQCQIQDEESRLNVATAPEILLSNLQALDRDALKAIMDRRGGLNGAQPFQCIDEVRALAAISDYTWLGTQQAPGLRGLLTCWGDGRININTAPREVLETIPGMAPGIIAILTTTRDISDFASFNEVTQKTGLPAEALAPLLLYCKFDSTFFTITGIGTLRQGKIRAVCSATVELSDNSVQVVAWREDTGE